MKKIFFILVFVLAADFLNAQVLYGTTSNGGDNDGGTICKLDVSAKTLTPVFSFDGRDAANANGSFIQLADGKLYGMAMNGGTKGFGAIFTYDPGTAVYKKIWDFDSVNGSHPMGGLLQGDDGNLYGMTSQGGSKDFGVIFSFNPVTRGYSKLFDFNYYNGASPQGELVQAANGKLYGVTYSGGNKGYGVLFAYDLAKRTYVKLQNFKKKIGRYPCKGLIKASDNKLYGMLQWGGKYDYGSIFSYDPATSIFSIVKDFDDGPPCGNLFQASDGKLYGVKASFEDFDVNGEIFSFDPVTHIYTKLTDIDYTNGIYIKGNLTEAADGRLYGMTIDGGDNFKGVFFSFDISSSTYKRLKNFDGINGAEGAGGVTLASDGKLYGMTTLGGSKDYGVIFSYDPAKKKYKHLRNFGSAPSGTNMFGGLTKGYGNKLYGMTAEGGDEGYGVIFSFDPVTALYTKLRDLDYSGGANPYGNLIQASNGKLYGLTQKGGSYNLGTIFSFDPVTLVYKKLWNFDYSDGANPTGSLVQTSDGKLYGTTRIGGYYGYSGGIIFSFDPSTATFTKLKDFDYQSGGALPNENLVQAGDGKLYGTTAAGGSANNGVIYSFDPVTLVYKELKNFDYSYALFGGKDNGNLIPAADGKLYGMTQYEGVNEMGTIFSFDPATSAYTRLKDFNYYTGTYPLGNLTQASDGKLYGMTSKGGANDYGVSFSYDPLTTTYQKLADLTGANGRNPQNTSFTEPSCETITYYRDVDGDGYGSASVAIKGCPKPDGYVSDSTDCNDNNHAVHPGANEICGNGIDDNCNGEVDEDCNTDSIRISVSDEHLYEGDTGNKLMQFTVKLNKTYTKPVSVTYTTINGAATAGKDYIAKSGKLIFLSGTKEFTVAVQVKGDTLSEPNETFKLKLTAATNATIIDSIGVGLIIDNDGNDVLAAAKQEPINSTKLVKLSPNPARNKVNIMLAGYSGNVTIQLGNMEGKILQQTKVNTSTKKSISQAVDVSNYTSGTYFITIIDEAANKQTGKLIIAR